MKCLKFPRPRSRSGSSRVSSPRSGLRAGHFRIPADEFERFQKTHGFTTDTAAPLRFLVVDDERNVADVVVASLRAFHPRARTETAGNGFEGLLKIGTFRPDVLLLHLGMPGMDGLEVCRQINRDPVIRETKVVVMTRAGP